MFIKVYVTGKYGLVGGEEAWRDMLQEYADMMHVGGGSDAFELWKKICYCEWRLTVVEVSGGMLRDFYSPAHAEALVEAGFDWVENLEDDKAYQKQLDNVMNEVSSVVVKLNQHKMDYDRLYPPSEGEKLKKTELDFDKELAILAKNGYKINKRKQMVSEYCAAVTAYLEEVKRNKRRN